MDTTDLELLIILQEKPVANDSTLARLTGLSSPTIKRRIDRLYELQAIERIQALLDYETLNLEYVSAFIEISSNYVERVTEIISKNQFIYYQVRCFGKANGVHATFRIPESEINSLQEQLNDLKKKELINGYELTAKIISEIRSKPRFFVYNSKTNTWDWDFLKWADISKERLFRGIEEEYLNEYTKPGINELDLIDIEILSIVSLNSRIKNVEILESLSTKISPQRLSDRLRVLKKYYIKSYRVYLNWEHIFHFLGFIFRCECDEETRKFFKVLLKYRPPPFETIFRESDRGFLLYAICPSNHMLDLIKVLDSKLDKFYIYFLDYSSSRRYHLNPKMFDPKNKTWKKE